MKELKKQMTLTALVVAACSIALACAITAIQADPPAHLPEELVPEWKLAQREKENLAEEATAEVDEPETIEEPQLTDLGEFKTTAYCTREKCCGKWADGITYTGTQATPGRTIAVDPDVIPLGSTVLIEGEAYIAEEIGGAIKGKRVDILVPTHGAAQEFGVRYLKVFIEK